MNRISIHQVCYIPAGGLVFQPAYWQMSPRIYSHQRDIQSMICRNSPMATSESSC